MAYQVSKICRPVTPWMVSMLKMMVVKSTSSGFDGVPSSAIRPPWVMCAIIDKKLSSAVGFKGVCKKVLILFMVGIANIVDLHVIGSGSALRGAVIAFYLSNEGLSLLENAAYIGLPIPDKLKAVLEQLHNRDEKEGKDDQGDGE